MLHSTLIFADFPEHSRSFHTDFSIENYPLLFDFLCVITCDIVVTTSSHTPEAIRYFRVLA